MRVWVTRDEDENGPLSRALRAFDQAVVLEPVLERHLVDDAAEAVSRLGPEDWLVLTSVYAIESVAADPARVPRVAVVGEPSRRAAEARGFRVELVSYRGDGESLFEELRTQARSGRVCYPRSSLVRAPEAWSGIELSSPVLYETHPREYDREVTGRVDVAAVASPSAVNAIGPVPLPFASIGPSTSWALRRIGVEPWIEAPGRSFHSLAQAIAG